MFNIPVLTRKIQYTFLNLDGVIFSLLAVGLLQVIKVLRTHSHLRRLVLVTSTVHIPCSHYIIYTTIFNLISYLLLTSYYLVFCSYISCNPETLVANAIELCTPSPPKVEKNKDNRGWRNMSSAGLARHRAKSMPASEPFQPVKAMAVDLFPHTSHCEMVMLLER